MTHIFVTNDTDPRDIYQVGASATAQFIVTSDFFDVLADIRVFKTVAGVDTELTVGADFNVVGSASFTGGFHGGICTLVVPVTNCQITILRDGPYLRTDDFPTTGQFNIDTLNTTLDRIVTLLQQLKGYSRRSPILPVSLAVSQLDPTFPAPVAGQLIGWDALALKFLNYDPAILKASNGVYNGAGAPGVGIGNNGDFYVDTANNVFYGPKAGGIWPAGGSLPTAQVLYLQDNFN